MVFQQGFLYFFMRLKLALLLLVLSFFLLSGCVIRNVTWKGKPSEIAVTPSPSPKGVLSPDLTATFANDSMTGFLGEKVAITVQTKNHGLGNADPSKTLLSAESEQVYFNVQLLHTTELQFDTFEFKCNA